MRLVKDDQVEVRQTDKCMYESIEKAATRRSDDIVFVEDLFPLLQIPKIDGELSEDARNAEIRVLLDDCVRIGFSGQPQTKKYHVETCSPAAC